MATTVITYRQTSDAWASFEPSLHQLIESRDVRRIVELGGGANPTLTLDFISRHSLDYAVLDISQTELDKAPHGYRKIRADICAADFSVEEKYDLAFSRMLAEHVPDGFRFHRNIRSLLADGGFAFHFFPTLFALPFVFNCLVPERWTDSLLQKLQSGRGREGKQGKFPAYYRKCRGPLRSQIAFFEQVGFDVEQYVGFFGHPGYYRRVPPLRRAHLALSGHLTKHPNPLFTSFAQVTLVASP